MILLAEDFPVPAASDFPRSPLTLLATGRADFFILSSRMSTHLQLRLKQKRRREEKAGGVSLERVAPPVFQQEGILEADALDMAVHLK